MKLIENFLTEDEHEYICDLMTSLDFAWYFSNYTHSENSPDGVYQFTHVFFKEGAPNSPFFNIAAFIAEQFTVKTGIKIKNFIRLKANFLPNQPHDDQNIIAGIHQDYKNDNFLSFVYYVVDCDGDLLIFKNDKKTLINSYTPKKNSLVYFKSNTWHGVQPPKISQKRIIINFVVEV